MGSTPSTMDNPSMHFDWGIRDFLHCAQVYFSMNSSLLRSIASNVLIGVRMGRYRYVRSRYWFVLWLEESFFAKGPWIKWLVIVGCVEFLRSSPNGRHDALFAGYYVNNEYV
jgi:hypothetical protein